MQDKPVSNQPPSAEQDSLLNLAAIFESEFSLDWLEELTGMKASKILSILEREVQDGSLQRIQPAVYRFRDTSKRISLLNRLSSEEKTRCCRNMASILMRDLPDDDSKTLVIGGFLLEISNNLNECEWILRAGDIYADSLQTEKAINCFEHVLAQLSGKHGENEDWLFIRSTISYSNVYGGRIDMATSIAYLQEARERARKIQKKPYELLLEMHLAKYERLGAELNKATERFEYAFSHIKDLNIPELSASITRFHTYFLFWQGRFRDVIRVYEESVPDVERYPIGHFPLMAGLMVGHCYTMTGQVTQGLGMLDTIRNYCYEKGDLYLSAHADSSIAMVMLSINRYEDTLRYLKLSIKESEESHNYWVRNLATLKLALIYHYLGNTQESLKNLRKFLKNSSGPQSNMLLYPYLIELCWAIESGGMPPITGLSIEQETERMLGLRNIFMQGIAYRYKALLGNARGWSKQEITRLFSSSVKLLDESGNQMELAKTYLEFTRYLLSTGNSEKAKIMMRNASKILSPIDVGLIPDDLQPLIENHNFEGSILNEIMNLTGEMGYKRNSGKLLQNIVATVNRITGAERGALLISNERKTSSRLELRASKNLTIEQIYDADFVSSRQMIDDVIDSGKGRILESGPAENAGDGAYAKERIRSSICVPLLSGKKVMGVLYHENRLLSNVFKEQDLKLLTFFAALAALQIDNEGAHQEISRLLQIESKENSALPRKEESTDTLRNHGIIGNSPAVNLITSQINRIAKSDTTVLILGETGVGKNLIAGALHRQSLRCNGPFITVQCSSLTESLITSELFGHEKGAFTGAINRHIGRFEMAHGGTLFLDEIGDLTLEVQARLLRVLQSKEFERVGGGKDVLVSDFRLIAATNRNLEQEIRAGRFREDLYYRINVFPLHIPPLRDRQEDIPLLVQHFVNIYSEKQKTDPIKIKQETMDALVRHNWPGNIRELQNVVQRGLISATGQYFHMPSFRTTEPSGSETDMFRTLREQERDHILKALQETRWKINGPGGTAQLLDINPSTLAFRMKKLGIKKPDLYKR
ncbi:MAG TPA: sigma 54-interacting transcriptional regulator [Syntrophorhabdaceae bacterium]|nr:sigma 54-interacting transcriptional regulator [Syntrophorhabdaceae bacterium]